MKFTIRRTALATALFGAFFAGMLNGASSDAAKVTPTRNPAVCQQVGGMGCPPFYGVQAPSWCAEDMICWIGSNADSRTDYWVIRDWKYQMQHASAN